MYSVTITSRAERDLKRLERSVKNRIVTAILALGNDPRRAASRLKANTGFGEFASLIGASVTK